MNLSQGNHKLRLKNVYEKENPVFLQGNHKLRLKNVYERENPILKNS
jgi:hypothetical protein